MHRPLPVTTSPADAGFTLSEVLVSITLVSLLVAGAAGLLGGASGAIRAGRVSTTATLLAVQKVEQLRADPASRTASGAYEDTTGAFTRRWTIVPADASSPLAGVTVEVFTSGAGRVATVTASMGGETP